MTMQRLASKYDISIIYEDEKVFNCLLTGKGIITMWHKIRFYKPLTYEIHRAS